MRSDLHPGMVCGHDLSSSWPSYTLVMSNAIPRHITFHKSASLSAFKAYNVINWLIAATISIARNFSKRVNHVFGWTATSYLQTTMPRIERCGRRKEHGVWPGLWEQFRSHGIVNSVVLAVERIFDVLTYQWMSKNVNKVLPNMTIKWRWRFSTAPLQNSLEVKNQWYTQDLLAGAFVGRGVWSN